MPLVTQIWLHYILIGTLFVMAGYSLFFCYEYRDRAFALFAGIALIPASCIFLRRFSPEAYDPIFETLRWTMALIGWALGLAYIRSLLRLSEDSHRLNPYVVSTICADLTIAVLQVVFPSIISSGAFLLPCFLTAVIAIITAHTLGHRYKNFFIYVTYSSIVFFIATVLDWTDMYVTKATIDVSWMYVFCVTTGMFTFSLTKIRLSNSLAQQREDFRTAVEQRQKMAALGEIASTIAHEVKNPLAALLYANDIQASLLKQASLDTAQITKMNQTVEKTARQIDKIVNSMAAVSRHPTSDPIECVNIRRLLEKVIDLFSLRLKATRTTLHAARIPEALTVYCRESQICQVILNLLNNAFDAVQPLAEQWIQIEAFEADDGVVIAVTDSGKGIDPGLHDKIVTTFFTTKEKGTGLGLGICKSILLQHEGKLKIVADHPHTRFEVWLPSPAYFNQP